MWKKFYEALSEKWAELVKKNEVKKSSMILNKTSNNTTNEFQIQFIDNEGFSEQYRFFLCQLQLKNLKLRLVGKGFMAGAQHNPPVKTRTLIHFWYTLSFMKCFQMFPSFRNRFYFFWKSFPFLLETVSISFGNRFHFFWKLFSFLFGTVFISFGNNWI